MARNHTIIHTTQTHCRLRYCTSRRQEGSVHCRYHTEKMGKKPLPLCPVCQHIVRRDCAGGVHKKCRALLPKPRCEVCGDELRSDNKSLRCASHKRLLVAKCARCEAAISGINKSGLCLSCVKIGKPKRAPKRLRPLAPSA